MTNPTLAMPISTAIKPTTGCWSSFVSGAGKSVNWCGRQIATAGKAAWSGIQKVAALAVKFFKKIAFYCGIGAAIAVTFVKAHASQFLIGGVCLAAGLAVGLLFSRLYGCCNKPVKLEELEDEPAAAQQPAHHDVAVQNPAVMDQIQQTSDEAAPDAPVAMAQQEPVNEDAAPGTPVAMNQDQIVQDAIENQA